MSVLAPFGRALRSFRAAAVAAVLVLSTGIPFAAPVEIPRIDAPVGSGGVEAAPAATGSSLLAPTMAAPSAAALSAPVAAAVPVLAAPAAALPVLPPAAAAAAPAASPAPSRAAAVSPARAVPAGSFGKRGLPSAGGEGSAAAVAAPASPEAVGDGDWARSAALFDLSGTRGADSVAPQVRAGLPENAAGKILLRLRQAGADGRDGPGAIPGMSRVEWVGAASHGNSGETTRIRIEGKPWFLKRLGTSPDPGIAAIPPETRARNEAGLASILRSDPRLSRSFSVARTVNVFRDGANVYVLTEGLPDVGDGESRRQELSAGQRADASIIQLVLGLGDMHGANVLPLGGGRFGLIDFEKLSRAPLERATPHEIDAQVMLKNFPLVDRLSANDPVVYRSRFEDWKKDYESGGRARMDRALADAGWSRPQREAYLAAVDRNAATYWDRLQPYLDYADVWHKRITAARAAAAKQEPPKKGLFGGLFGSR